jgi:molybdenum cofactor synthesis domain-containing protein
MNSIAKSMATIRSAGCLIIGDEVLNGKIQDTNSFEFAKFCFNQLKIPLKKVIVCSDDKQDIKSSLDILDKHVDLIVTSGGLGSTHDDVSYEAIASYYNLQYKLDEDVVSRMNRLRSLYLKNLSPNQVDSFYKMATLPCSSSKINVNKIFVDKSLWFPIVAIDHKVFILPGIPQLFTKLINHLYPILAPRIQTQSFTRLYVKTSSGESEFASFLLNFQCQLDEKYGINAIKLGSYPHIAWKLNTISIIINLPNFSDSQKSNLVKSIIDGVAGNAVEIDSVEEDRLSNELPKDNKLRDRF